VCACTNADADLLMYCLGRIRPAVSQFVYLLD
jgi:hypothetical protein